MGCPLGRCSRREIDYEFGDHTDGSRDGGHDGSHGGSHKGGGPDGGPGDGGAGDDNSTALSIEEVTTSTKAETSSEKVTTTTAKKTTEPVDTVSSTSAAVTEISRTDGPASSSTARTFWRNSGWRFDDLFLSLFGLCFCAQHEITCSLDRRGKKAAPRLAVTLWRRRRLRS